MKNIRSRRWVGKSGLFVEEIYADGSVVSMLYKKGKATKFWRSAWLRGRSA